MLQPWVTLSGWRESHLTMPTQNMSLRYNYTWVKISKNFEHKNVIIFLSIGLNLCFGCSKEPSHWDGSFEYPPHMLWLRNKKNNFQMHTLIWRLDERHMSHYMRFWYISHAKKLPLNTHTDVCGGDRDLVFGLSLPFSHTLYMGEAKSGETAHLHMLLWASATHSCNKYSKNGLKQPLKNRQNKGFKDKW